MGKREGRGREERRRDEQRMRGEAGVGEVERCKGGKWGMGIARGLGIQPFPARTAPALADLRVAGCPPP